jgi:hypothetical protein
MCEKFWLESLKGRDHSEDRRRWEDNIKMDVRDMGLEGVDWIRLVQDRDRRRALVSTVMNIRVP